MVLPISAAELYSISETNLRDAIESFREDALPRTFRDSTRFDLLVDGHRRYPPKAIVALAALHPLGRDLSSEEFKGGESSSIFRLLMERGFAFATKLAKVGMLDATFSVGRDFDSEFVLFESKGPERNVDYLDGLEAVLRGLADRDASVDDVVIDSADTRRLPLHERQLVLRSHKYPILLRQQDISELRRDITATAAATARSTASAGGGNPTKRLRITIRQSDPLTLFKLAQFLAQGDSRRISFPREFSFTPSAPSASASTGTRGAVEVTEVTHIHARMQCALYKEMVSAWGIENVSAEQIMSSGCPADLVLRREDAYELFEIKTALAARDCIREALGQLLEYAYWPHSPRFDTLWVVGPSEADGVTHSYLHGLRERFGIPLQYRHQAMSSIQTP